MIALRVERCATGPRLYLFGHRVHHFVVGALAVAGGAAACWHDRRDVRICLVDLRRRS